PERIPDLRNEMHATNPHLFTPAPSSRSQAEPGNGLSWRLCLAEAPETENAVVGATGRQSLQDRAFPGGAWGRENVPHVWKRLITEALNRETARAAFGTSRCAGRGRGPGRCRRTRGCPPA